jgi:homoserine O-acetyltransferase
MGGMHTWVWGYTYPDFMDALLPLASAPVEIAGRNRMWRWLLMDAIRSDPEWKNGDYQQQPRGLREAQRILFLVGGSPLQYHRAAPTRAEADAYISRRIASAGQGLDANDTLYQFDASRTYNPAPHLDKIVAPLVAVNSADDLINPPELGFLGREIKKVKRGRYVLLPITGQTVGHGSHTVAALWMEHLEALLRESERTDR